jgi:hypothetical protein
MRAHHFWICSVVLVAFFRAGTSSAQTPDKDKKPEPKQDLPKAIDLKEKQAVSYKVTVPAGRMAEFWVESNKNTDVDVYVYDLQDKLVVSDTRVSKDCYVSWVTSKKEETYRIKIENLGPGENHCKLKFALKELKDTVEVVKELPKVIDLKAKQKVAYHLELPADVFAECWVDSEKNGDVDLFVYDLQGGMVVSDIRVSKDCYVSWVPSRKQIYRIEIENLGPGENRSKLKLSTRPLKRVEYKTIDLKARESQEFKIDFAAGKRVHFLVDSEKDTDVDLIVVDADGKEVAADRRLSKDCYVSWTPEKAQTFRLRVENLGSDPNRCRLSYIVEDKGPEKK